MASPSGERSFAATAAKGEVAPKAVAGTRVDLRNPKFEWRADPPLYRGLRERCPQRRAWVPVLSRIRASHDGLNYASNRAGLWPP
jgi:hypothetical protein